MGRVDYDSSESRKFLPCYSLYILFINISISKIFYAEQEEH